MSEKTTTYQNISGRKLHVVGIGIIDKDGSFTTNKPFSNPNFRAVEEVQSKRAKTETDESQEKNVTKASEEGKE